MSDHYFGQATLETMRDYIREHGRHPEPDPNSMKFFRKALEEAKASGDLKKLYKPHENNDAWSAILIRFTFSKSTFLVFIDDRFNKMAPLY